MRSRCSTSSGFAIPCRRSAPTAFVPWWSAFAPTPAKRWPPPPDARRLFPAPPLLTQPHLLGELRTRYRVIRRHHRVVGGQAPFVAVLFGRHVVLGAQMALQRLEALAIL